MYITNYRGINDGYYMSVAISKIKDTKADTEIKEYKKLIPDRNFEGKLECEEKIREYIRYYYLNVLSELDPKNVYEELKWNKLVTFDDGEFSHAYIVAAWIELYLGIEVKCINDETVKFIDVKPKWTIDILEDEIKKTIDNMKGFNSVRALYLFEQGEKLERRAEELEQMILSDKTLTKERIYKLSDTADSYRQSACFRRCDADMAEDEWRERRYKLIEETKKRTKKK